MADDVIRNAPARYPARYGVHLSNIINRISWGAVWAGVMIAFGMEALLTLFGLCIGFGMFHSQAANPWASIPGWSAIWYLVTAGWSMFFGAWCAARLSGNPVREAGILHGITTWGLATAGTMAVMVLASWAVLREGVNVLSTAALAGAEIAAPAIHQTPPSQLPPAAQQPGQALNELQRNVAPTEQATANTIARLSLITFLGLIVGLVTAILGGLAGRPRAFLIEEQQTPAGPSRLAA
jgi:hypothetical protein